MPNQLPTPLAAAIGLVPALLSQAWRLPGRAVQLPVIAVSNALATMDALRTGYDDLAVRGERLVAHLRGQAADGVDAAEDRVEDLVGRTPFAGAYDKAEDTLEDAAEAAEQAVANVAPLAGRVRRATGDAAAGAAGAVAGFATGAADTAKDAAGTAADAAGTAASTAADAAGTAAVTAADAASTAAGTAADATTSAADAAARAAGTAADAAAGSAGSAAEGTAQAFAGAVDQAAGTAEDAAGAAANTVGAATEAAGTAATAAGTAAPAAGTPARPDAEAPKGVPTPRATEPDSTRIDSAASQQVQQTVEEIVMSTPNPELDHDELPLPDYDHMTLGSLRGRLRALDLQQLVQIRTYEKAHADRLPIVTMLDNRIAKLSADPSAAPSGPVSTSPAPEQLAAGPATPSRGVSPATTTAPTINPPSQGDPTNPSQPR